MIYFRTETQLQLLSENQRLLPFGKINNLTSADFFGKYPQIGKASDKSKGKKEKQADAVSDETVETAN